LQKAKRVEGEDDNDVDVEDDAAEAVEDERYHNPDTTTGPYEIMPDVSAKNDEPSPVASRKNVYESAATRLVMRKLLPVS